MSFRDGFTGSGMHACMYSDGTQKYGLCQGHLQTCFSGVIGCCARWTLPLRPFESFPPKQFAHSCLEVVGGRRVLLACIHAYLNN